MRNTWNQTDRYERVFGDSNLGGVFQIDLEEIKLPQNYSCKVKEITEVCDFLQSGLASDPVVLNSDNMIIDGKKRYYAYKRLNRKTILAVRRLSYIEDFLNEDFKIIGE